MNEPVSEPTVRVMLVDDQELIRAGLTGLLRARFGFEVVAELGDGADVVATAARVRRRRSPTRSSRSVSPTTARPRWASRSIPTRSGRRSVSRW